MSPDDDAAEPEPVDPDEASESEDADDDAVSYGLDVYSAALDRQIACVHSFDPRFCPFGCA